MSSNGSELDDARPMSVAVNPVALVVTECITVTSAMRKHARWAHSSVAAILGGSSSRAPAVVRRDRGGQGTGMASTGGEQDDAAAAATTATAAAATATAIATTPTTTAPASRWGLRGKKGKSLQDNPLMSAFARLRSDIKGCKG